MSWFCQQQKHDFHPVYDWTQVLTHFLLLSSPLDWAGQRAWEMCKCSLSVIFSMGEPWPLVPWSLWSKIMSDFSSSSNKLVSFQSGVRDYFTSPSNCAPIHWTPGPTLSQNSKSCCWSWSSSVVWDALLSLVEELLVCNWWGVVIVPSLGRIT